MLGLAALQSGDVETAATALKSCLERNPNEAALWEIYGSALEALQRHQDAADAYSKATKAAPDRASAHRLRGISLYQTGQYKDAALSFETAVHLDQQDADAWFWKGAVHYALVQMDGAEAALTNAINLRPNWHKAWLNRATVRADMGRREDALADYQKAIDLGPNDPAVFRQFAIALWEMQSFSESEQMFNQSLALEPNHASTRASMAGMYEQANRLDDAKHQADQAVALDPENWLARKTLAVLKRRSGDTGAALQEMRALYETAIGRADKAAIAFELAQTEDTCGNVDEAYRLFAEGNELQWGGPAARRISLSDFEKRVQSETRILAASSPVDVSPAQIDTPPDPIFLIGFPRSGTTLLDQVLDSHPDIIVMDERPPLAEVHDRITQLEVSVGEPLTHLNEEQRHVARQFYFQCAAEHVQTDENKVLVDKHPLATARARIIKLLFPRAKIVFALRHPCDVVLSAFMQSFTINQAMAQFHTLDGAVRSYETVMSLWRQAEPNLNLPVHYIRYENLVRDFETEVKDVLSFIGLPWDERVTAFHEHAQSRDIRTASARQVTQPLYTSALARWERYEKYLEPHLPVLEPFIRAFGYQRNP